MYLVCIYIMIISVWKFNCCLKVYVFCRMVFFSSLFMSCVLYCLFFALCFGDFWTHQLKRLGLYIHVCLSDRQSVHPSMRPKLFSEINLRIALIFDIKPACNEEEQGTDIETFIKKLQGEGIETGGIHTLTWRHDGI